MTIWRIEIEVCCGKRSENGGRIEERIMEAEGNINSNVHDLKASRNLTFVYFYHDAHTPNSMDLDGH